MAPSSPPPPPSRVLSVADPPGLRPRGGQPTHPGEQTTALPSLCSISEAAPRWPGDQEADRTKSQSPRGLGGEWRGWEEEGMDSPAGTHRTQPLAGGWWGAAGVFPAQGVRPPQVEGEVREDPPSLRGGEEGQPGSA